MASDDPWYFPRRELAREFLDLFETSGTTALTLFAARRAGKTTFLTRDLEPEAAARGYVPIYVDFWETIGSAADTLLQVLDQTLQQIQLPKSRLAQLLKQPMKSLSLLGFSLEFGDLVVLKKPKLKLMQIRWYLSQLIGRTKRPVLLMLDEFQQVALDAEGEKLAASLRSALQQLHPAVRVIFSGSSESRLAEMFRRTRAPLYKFSSEMPFPLLDRDFSRFIAERHKAATGRKLNEPALWRAFLALNRQPEALKELVLELIKRASTDVVGVLDAHVQRMKAQDEDSIAAQFKSLKPLDRLVLERVAHGEAPLSKASQRLYAEELGVETVHVNNIGRALKKLTKLDLVRGLDRSYQVTNEAVAEHLRRGEP